MDTLALCVFVAGCTVHRHPLPRLERQPGVSIEVSDSSGWRVLEDDTVVVASSDANQTAVLVDWTDHRSDNRHPGFILTHKGVSFAGRYREAEAPFFVPDIPETQESLRVRIADSALALHMRCGSYADIKRSGDPIIDTMPVVFDASVFAGKPEMTLELSGLYYILLPMAGTTLHISYISGRVVDSICVEPQRGRILRYYDDVRTIEARTSRFGDWRIETDARRLQIDIPAIEGGTDLFELDFDHSYKDRGQRSVRSLVHIRH